MIKTHKRTKNSRIRGARTCGWGFRQKHKGHGNKGGFGMAGSHAHKRQITESSADGKYFGKQGVTSRGTKRDKTLRLNLRDIKDNIFKKDGDKIDLKKYVILATGEGFKAEVTALKASKAAIEKMEKAGGKIIIPVKMEKPVAEKELEEETEKPKKVAKKVVAKEKPVKKVKKVAKKLAKVLRVDPSLLTTASEKSK